MIPVGVFTHADPDLSAPYFADSLRGIARALEGFEHEIRINPNPDDVPALLILGPAEGDPSLASAARRKTPAVVLQGASDIFPSVGLDNVGAARKVVEHLISAGRYRVAVINGRMYVADGRDRFEGYKQALKARGLPFEKSLAVEAEFDEKKGFAAMKALLSLSRPPDAVFAANDHMAEGALKALREAGRRVPGDVAVAGFDDMASAGALGLTTFRQPFEKIAFEGAKILRDWLSTGKSPGAVHRLVEGALVPRASSQKA